MVPTHRGTTAQDLADRILNGDIFITPFPRPVRLYQPRPQMPIPRWLTQHSIPHRVTTLPSPTRIVAPPPLPVSNTMCAGNKIEDVSRTTYCRKHTRDLVDIHGDEQLHPRLRRWGENRTAWGPCVVQKESAAKILSTPDSGYHTADLVDDENDEVLFPSTPSSNKTSWSSVDPIAAHRYGRMASPKPWSPVLTSKQSIALPGLYDDVDDDLDVFIAESKGFKLVESDEDVVYKSSVPQPTWWGPSIW